MSYQFRDIKKCLLSFSLAGLLFAAGSGQKTWAQANPEDALKYLKTSYKDGNNLRTAAEDTGSAAQDKSTIVGRPVILPDLAEATPVVPQASLGQARGEESQSGEVVGTTTFSAPIVTETPPPPEHKVIVDPNVVPASSCSSCSSGLLGTGPNIPSAGCPGSCCGSNCVPGRTHCCSVADPDSHAGRFLYGLYNCICCPDPCYEPHWVPFANASFYADGARPVTQTRLRYDGLWDIDRPDRAQYFIAPNSSGGPPPAGSAQIHQFSLYTEVAAGGFSFFIDMPYRSIDFNDPPQNGDSGFGNLNLGTKSLLLDCELLQATFQFRTFIPTASSGTGLANGIASLEPSMLFALKLSPDFYMQWQTAYWIPIGGDPNVAGDIWRNNFSFNKAIWYILPDVQVIGVLDFTTYSVLDGAYTLQNGTLVNGRDTFFGVGPGVRLNVCNKIDFGVGSNFALTSTHFANQQVVVELRWRF